MSAYLVSVFPPTGFHRLDTRSFAFESVETTGSCPGWIYKHRAILLTPDEIKVTGGTVVKNHEDGEIHAPNLQTFEFDTSLSFWRIA